MDDFVMDGFLKEKLVYDKHGLRIFHGDCMEILPHLGTGTVDAYISDRPYGVNHTSKRFGRIANDDGSFPTIPCIKECLRIVKQYGCFFDFGDFDFKNSGLPISNLKNMVWNKVHKGMGSETAPRSNHEDLRFFRNAKNAKRTEYLQKVPPDSVITEFPKRGKRMHPNEKPVKLLQGLIEYATQPGDTIIDVCMGSGSALVAALSRNRKAIGIELDKKYCLQAGLWLDECFARKAHLDEAFNMDARDLSNDRPPEEKASNEPDQNTKKEILNVVANTAFAPRAIYIANLIGQPKEVVHKHLQQLMTEGLLIRDGHRWRRS